MSERAPIQGATTLPYVVRDAAGRVYAQANDASQAVVIASGLTAAAAARYGVELWVEDVDSGFIEAIIGGVPEPEPTPEPVAEEA